MKNRAFAAETDFAKFRAPITAAEVTVSRVVAAPLHLLMCSPLTDGAAALVLRADSPASGPTLATSQIASHMPGSPVVTARSPAHIAT